MKLKNSEVKVLQDCLRNIMDNIQSNMNIVGNEEITEVFLFPIMRVAADVSDKLFTQTRDAINDVNV